MNRVHVVAAAICDDAGRLLIARRPEHVHQGGRWEFPGGKVEAGESAEQALARELFEELGIRPRSARPLIKVAHDYAEQAVLLDAWRVDSYTGEVRAREDQPLRWVPVEALREFTFPAANRAIIAALQLPHLVLVTPAPQGGRERFLSQLSRVIERHGLRLVYLRAPELARAPYLALAERVLAVCAARGAHLMLAAAPDDVVRLGARGMHLSSAAAARWSTRPIGGELLLSVACHDARELHDAIRLDPDFVFLSPVEASASHPGARPLGWPAFSELVAMARCPVYALGGMRLEDLPRAQAAGAQGVAAIRALWD